MEVQIMGNRRRGERRQMFDLHKIKLGVCSLAVGAIFAQASMPAIEEVAQAHEKVSKNIVTMQKVGGGGKPLYC